MVELLCSVFAAVMHACDACIAIACLQAAFVRAYGDVVATHASLVAHSETRCEKKT